jgi:hypothetical protein
MENIYASSVARCVFVWIAIVVFIIGFIWNFIVQKRLSSKVGEIADTVQDGLITAVSFIPGYGTAVGAGASALKWLGKYGGRALMGISAYFLLIYEAFWNPWRHLKGVKHEDIKRLVEEAKKSD